MADKTGAARLRQAIKNQRDLGNGDFRLTYHDAEEIADEVEDELARVSWAEGVPAPVDADGEAVPLTTKVMYTNRGKKIELSEFHLLHSVLSGGFVWRATRDTDHGVEDLKLDFLHLRRPDSWGKLEEDVQRVKETGDICGYYDKVDKPCDECPALNIPGMCSATMLRDVLRRAKALAERDARGSTPQTSPHGAKEAAE